MKQLFVFSLMVALLLAHPPSLAQDETDCDPAILREWMIARQAWRNETTKVWNEGDDVLEVALIFHEHLQAITELERPKCADEAMLWTYYYYHISQHYLLCYNSERADCNDTVLQEQSDAYGAHIVPIIEDLEAIAGIDLDDYVGTIFVEDLPAVGSVATDVVEGDDERIVEYEQSPFFISGELEIDDEDGDGIPHYSYFLEPIEVIPGVRVIQAASLTPGSSSGRVTLGVFNNTDQVQQIEYVLDIPKSFAADVSDLTFSLEPTQIINADPVVVFNVSTDPNDFTLITGDSSNVQPINDDMTDVLTMLKSFEYERNRRYCDEQKAANQAYCYQALMTHFPNHVTDVDCDRLGQAIDVTNPNREAWYLACRAIVTHDGWECSRLDDTFAQGECRANVATALTGWCESFSGEAETSCLVDAAITSGVERVCSQIPADYAAVKTACQAQVTSDPTVCKTLEDTASRLACCETFAGTDAYDQCAGEAVSSSASVATGLPREGYYHVVSTTWGTLYDGETQHDDYYVALKVCDEGERLDYVGAFDPDSLNSLCIRRDQYGGLFWRVTPGEYESTSEEGFAQIIVESETQLHYYRENMSHGYSSYTDSVFEWYSELESP